MVKKLMTFIMSGFIIASFNLQGFVTAATNKNVKTAVKVTTKTTARAKTTTKFAPNTLVRLYSKDIPINEFKTLIAVSAINYQLNNQKAIWNQVDPTTKKKVTDIVQQNVLNIIISNNVQKVNAVKAGIELTAEQDVTVANDVYKNIQVLDTNATINKSYKEALKKINLSDKDFRNYFKQLIRDGYILNNLKSKLYSEYKPTITQTVIEQTYLSQYQKVGARHILIGVGEYSKDGNRTDADAKKLASEVLGKLNKGAKFEDLVNQYSDDNGSLSTGGYYEFGRGDMVTAFENTAFSQKDGQVSQPVKTDYGYHIIQTVKHIAANVKNMTAEIKSNITNYIKTSKFQSYYADKVKQWTKDAKVTVVKSKIDIAK